MMPSRDFFLRQAILNAAHSYWPATVRMEGVARALTLLAGGGSITLPFHAAINREFRKLTERNWEPMSEHTTLPDCGCAECSALRFVGDYHFACTSCGQPRGGRHWSTCAYSNLTSPYVVDSQCHRVNSTPKT